MTTRLARIGHHFGQTLGRALIPLLALLIILGTLWWGPWITLVVAAVLWYGIGHLV